MKTTQYKMNKIKLILLSALALAMFYGNAIAAESKDKESFTAKVVKAFPDYNRMNYLDMTAGYLFSN